MDNERLLRFRFLGPAGSRLLPEPDDSTIGYADRDFSPSICRHLTDEEKFELQLKRRQILTIFEVANLKDIYPTYAKNQENKDRANDRLIGLYGGLYSKRELTHDEKKERMSRALKYSDSVIQRLVGNEGVIPRYFHSIISPLNEIELIDRPVDLFLLAFSPKASRRMRYEARRKLILTELALCVMGKTEEKNGAQSLDNFLRLLNRHIWEGGSGQTIPVELISNHDPQTYACTFVRYLCPLEKAPSGLHVEYPNGEIISEEDGKNLRLSPDERYSRFEARVWKDIRGNKHWAYLEHREKDVVSSMLKLLRKDTIDPHAIDDDLGIKLTFPSKVEAKMFLEKLQLVMQQVWGKIYETSDIYDTIDNDISFRVTNHGSNKKLEIMKLHISFGGERLEFQIHTPRTYLDSRYHSEIGWDIYAVSRLFESGVITTLFPQDIYGINFPDYLDSILEQRRTAVRRSGAELIPKKRRRDGKLQIPYTYDSFRKDIPLLNHALKSAMSNGTNWDVVVPMDNDALIVAHAVAEQFPGIKLRYREDEIVELVAQLSAEGKKILLVSAIGSGCHLLQRLENPNVTTAVLLYKPMNPQSAYRPDIIGREDNSSQWLTFAWGK